MPKTTRRAKCGEEANHGLDVSVHKPSKGSIAAQILDIVRDADRLMGIPSIR